MLIEDNNFFNEEEKTIFNNIEFFLKIPLYFHKKLGGYGHSPTLVHTTVARIENNSHLSNRSCSNKVNNLLFPILDRFTKKHNLPLNRVLRGSINCTVPSEEIISHIHRDHTFEHYVFLMYLNTTFNGGNTFIYDDDKNLIATIKPEMHKIICFKGNNHSFEYPAKGMRFVVVYTFD
jgi:hypothetical protein